MQEDRSYGSADRRKRGWFAPIALALLTLSLMGNVFFYSDRLHDSVSGKQQEGLEIIRQQSAAKVFFADTGKGLTELLQSDGPDERAGAMYRLGLAFGRSGDVAGLIGKASERRAESMPTASAEDAGKASAAAVEKIGNMLSVIGAQAGPLTDAERSYLESLNALFAAMSQSAESLDTEFSTKEAAMTARAGGEWVDAAHEWAELLGEAAALPKPTA